MCSVTFLPKQKDKKVVLFKITFIMAHSNVKTLWIIIEMVHLVHCPLMNYYWDGTSGTLPFNGTWSFSQMYHFLFIQCALEDLWIFVVLRKNAYIEYNMKGFTLIESSSCSTEYCLQFLQAFLQVFLYFGYSKLGQVTKSTKLEQYSTNTLNEYHCPVCS